MVYATDYCLNCQLLKARCECVRFVSPEDDSEQAHWLFVELPALLAEYKAEHGEYPIAAWNMPAPKGDDGPEVAL